MVTTAKILSWCCKQFYLTHYNHGSRINTIKGKQVRAELLVHKLFKSCPIDVALIDPNFYHPFHANNRNCGYPRSPVLRLTFDCGSCTDRAIAIRTRKSFVLQK